MKVQLWSALGADPCNMTLKRGGVVFLRGWKVLAKFNWGVWLCMQNKTWGVPNSKHWISKMVLKRQFKYRYSNFIKIWMKIKVKIIKNCSLLFASLGSGIFISPKSVLDRTGSVGLSLVVWIASGFLALLGKSHSNFM